MPTYIVNNQTIKSSNRPVPSKFPTIFIKGWNLVEVKGNGYYYQHWDGTDAWFQANTPISDNKDQFKP
jgi:hypothetical protein